MVLTKVSVRPCVLGGRGGCDGSPGRAGDPCPPVSPVCAASRTCWSGPVTSWASSCSTGRPTCATWPWRACARWPAPSSPTRRSRRTSTPSSTPSRCNFWEPVLATLTWPMAPLLPWSNLGTQRPWVTSPGSLEHTLPALLPQTERDVSVRQRAADLLYAMCDRSNAKQIVSEMLRYLETADYAIREEIVSPGRARHPDSRVSRWGPAQTWRVHTPNSPAWGTHARPTFPLTGRS